MNSRVRWSFVSEPPQAVHKRIVLIYRLEQYLWTAQCLSLPGCNIKGETKGEALVNIHKEVREHLGELMRRNLPIPEETFDTAVIEIY